jgi:hypothetical protein
VEAEFTAATSKVDVAKPDAGHFEKAANGNGYLIADNTNSSLYALFALLKDGVKAYRLTGAGVDPGTIYIPAQEGVEERLTAIAEKFPIEIRPTQTAPTGNALLVHLPRIALYQSWVASMDEGWTRWIFDQNKIPYTRVVDADIRKGDLSQKFDVILIPDNAARAITTGRGGYGEGLGGPSGSESTSTAQTGTAQTGAAAGGPRSNPAEEQAGVAVQPTAPAEATRGPKQIPEYSGGLGDDGLASLKAFIENGGTIVTLNKASQVYTAEGGPVSDALAKVNRKEFFIPGSILQITVDPTNPIAFGSAKTVPIFYENGPTFAVNGSAQSIASFTSDNPLLSGWIQGGQFLKGTSVIAQESVGKGQIILFGFRPQYRAQSEVTYKFLFNALLSSSSTAQNLAENAHGQ